MRRLVGLDNDLALFAFAACATRHLSHQLEAALVGTEVGERKHVVGVKDAHHLHRVEVQSFCDHLRTHEDVGLMVLESLQNALIIVF